MSGEGTKWDLYETQLRHEGDSRRDRVIKRTQELTARLSPESHVYKKCKNGNKTIRIDVIRSDRLNQKMIYTMPGRNEDFKLGDLVVWAGRHWLVLEVDADDEIHRRGRMEECNHLFRWQNSGSSTICESYGIVENPYSRNIAEGKVLTEPFNQLRFLLPYTDTTKRWYKGKRIGLEVGYNKKGEEILVSYEILDNSSVSSNFGNGRYLTVMAQFSDWNQTDSILEMIADYMPPEPTSEPTIVGPTKIRAGSSAYATFSYGADADADDGALVWFVDFSTEYETLIEYTVDAVTGNLLLRVLDGDDSVIGEYITIRARLGDSEAAVLVPEVVSIYGG